MDVLTLSEQVQHAAMSEDPSERRAKLRVIRSEAAALVEQIDVLLADDSLLREAALQNHDAILAAARRNATIREELIARGMATIMEMDEGGMLSHDVLDALEADGVLEAALHELYAAEADGDVMAARDRQAEFHQRFLVRAAGDDDEQMAEAEHDTSERPEGSEAQGAPPVGSPVDVEALAARPPEADGHEAEVETDPAAEADPDAEASETPPPD